MAQNCYLKSDLDVVDCCKKGLRQIQDNVYYGCFRGPWVAELPNLNKLKLIVQTRHPLDCITSAFFSFRNSHSVPINPERKKDFIEICLFDETYFIFFSDSNLCR